MVVIVLGRAVNAVAGLAIMALLTRHLGPEGYGEYRTVLAYTAFAYLTSDLGLYAYTLRAISEPAADRGAIIAIALRLRLLLAIAFMSIATVLSLFVPFSPVVHAGIALSMLGYLCHGGSDLLLAAFQQELRQSQFAVAEILGALLTLALACLVVVAGLGVFAAVGALVGGFVIAFACHLLMIRNSIDWTAAFDWPEARRMLIGSLPFAGALILGLIYSRLDIVFLSLLQSPAAVGVYGIAHKVADVAMALPYFFAGLVLPALVNAAATNSGKFGDIFSKAFIAMAVAGAGVMLVTLLFADVLVSVLAGDDFLPAAGALQIMGVKVGTFCIANLLVFTTTALGLQGQMLKGHAIAAAVSVIGYLCLIPLYSYNGAAISTTLAEIAVLLFATYLVASRMQLAAAPIVLMKCLGAAAIAYFLVSRTLPADLHWVAQLVLVGSTYLVLVSVLRTGAWSAFRTVFAR
jgi:O-antigen/teichoic acid export membrane protein